MNIEEFGIIIATIRTLSAGSIYYEEVNKLLQTEITTHNAEELVKLYNKIKG